MSVISNEDNTKGPQEELNDFWENLISKRPRKVTNIFPSSLYANLLPPQRQPGPAKGKNAAESYETAAKECRARVEQIIRECERTNEKVINSKVCWVGTNWLHSVYRPRLRHRVGSEAEELP